jgi:hypothetical protein
MERFLAELRRGWAAVLRVSARGLDGGLDMPERGGPRTQSRVIYQNKVTALYLGRLIDPRPYQRGENVIEVRVEAPTHVDDIVLRFADGHHEWMQVKESIDIHSRAWKKLWRDFESQRWGDEFGDDDRILLVLGNVHAWSGDLRELCSRASGSADGNEWMDRLTTDQESLLDKVRPLLSEDRQDTQSLFALFANVEVHIIDSTRIEADYVQNYMPKSNRTPLDLFDKLLRITGEHAVIRRVFERDTLLEQLGNELVEIYPHHTVVGVAVKPSSPDVPFQVPEPRANFVPRPEVTRDLKELLIGEEPVGKDAGRVVAIHGLPGSGKSVMAEAVARDPEVVSHFSDGVLWATLGQDPNVSEFLGGCIQELKDFDFQSTAAQAALRHLTSLLREKSVLIVIDDAWDPAHVTAMLTGGPRCAVLITTREAVVAKAAGVTQDNLYELKVMKPEQSMALLAGGAGRTLPEAVRPLAREVAEAVGHLPLALELAAAQAAEGVPWDELHDDLTLEIARLESLEDLSAEEIRDPALKKRLSLIGSLNLSLRRLSSSRLKQFAWFGVLPDDVVVTPAPAATLWATDVRSARDSLRYFRSKALLALGDPLPDGPPTYKIHDMLHEMAKRLLTGEREPEDDHRLPGLGLELEVAHAQLVDRYRAETQNGLWHTVPDDGYILAHLGWHLERANLRHELYDLISEDWMEAKLARFGSYQSFASDVERMIVAAKQETPIRWEHLIRGCLIYASVGSMATNVPPEALGVLVQTGDKDQVSTALGHAALIRDKRKQSDAYRLIGEALLTRGETAQAKEMLGQALAAAEAIGNEGYRAEALSGVAQALAQGGRRKQRPRRRGRR